MSEEPTKEKSEDVYTLHGSDSVFAIRKESSSYGYNYYMYEHINGAPSIRMGQVNSDCIGRFLTWLNRIGK